MSDIFISYKSEDRERIQTLVRALAQKGWSVWWDRTIPPGRTFDEVIEEALNDAKCVIVIWSKQSVTSKWVKTEAAEGERRAILIPVLIDDVKIPLEFRRIQAASLVDWQGALPHSGFDELSDAVAKIVGHSPGGVTPSVQEQEAAERLEKEHQEREAREKAAREEAEHKAREKAGKEEAERKLREERQQPEQITTLYERARGLIRLQQWQPALEKMNEIRALDPQFEDPEGITAKAQEELTREAKLLEQDHQEREAHEKAEEERKAKAEREIQEEKAYPSYQQKVEVTPKKGIPTKIIAAVAIIAVIIIAAIIVYNLPKKPPKESEKKRETAGALVPAQILDFSAKTSTIKKGESATLEWKTSNAKEVEISGIGKVELSDSMTISPIETTTYTLTARGEEGNAIERNVTVEVTVSPTEITNPEMRNFVDKYVAVFNQGNISEILALYADQVDYFGKGIVTKDFIRRDKEYYLKRWPEVHNRLNGDITLQDASDKDTKVMTFIISYYAKSPQRGDTASGTAENTLKVRKINGNLLIIDEKQKILSHNNE